MSQIPLIIHCIDEDRSIGLRIKQKLAEKGIDSVFAGSAPSAQESIVSSDFQDQDEPGFMILVLSNSAVNNNEFLSIAQSMFEAANGKDVPLEKKYNPFIIFEVERTADTDRLDLITNCSIRINAVSQAESAYEHLYGAVRNCLDPESVNSAAPKMFSRKTMLWVLGFFALLGVVGYFLLPVMGFDFQSDVEPTPTPVVLYVPFSGESQDAGHIVDQREAPFFEYNDNPQTEAPFLYDPGFVLKQDDFEDQRYEGTYNFLDWRLNCNDLNILDQISVYQKDGVLQVLSTPQNDSFLQFTLDSRYLLMSDQFDYLGIRIRFLPYEGIMNSDTQIYNMVFFSQSSYWGSGHTFLLSERPPDGSWYALEFVRKDEMNSFYLYLNGQLLTLIDLNGNEDQKLDSLLSLLFMSTVSNTTDWTGYQIDEIVFGTKTEPQPNMQREQAQFLFSPETIILQNDFSNVYTENLVLDRSDDRIQISSRDGVFEFTFPPGNENMNINFDAQAEPVSDMNYFAVRFRYTEDDDLWDMWGGISLIYRNRSYLANNTFSLEFGRHAHGVGLWETDNKNASVEAFNQYTQTGTWHTLELLAVEDPDDASRILLSGWLDRRLVGYIAETDVQVVELFTSTEEDYLIQINIASGENRKTAFSGEIDEFIIGYIPFSQLPSLPLGE